MQLELLRDIRFMFLHLDHSIVFRDPSFSLLAPHLHSRRDYSRPAKTERPRMRKLTIKFVLLLASHYQCWAYYSQVLSSHLVASEIGSTIKSVSRVCVPKAGRVPPQLAHWKLKWEGIGFWDGWSLIRVAIIGRRSEEFINIDWYLEPDSPHDDSLGNIELKVRTIQLVCLLLYSISLGSF